MNSPSHFDLLKRDVTSLVFAFTIFLEVFSTRVCHSQHEYLFENYNASQGLTVPEVNSLYKDRQGFLWIGAANGLCRFDGVHFDIVQDPRGDLQGDMAINHIVGDRYDNIWTASIGVTLIQKRNNFFRKFSFVDANNQPIPPPRCLKVIVDPNGDVWTLSDKLNILVDSVFKPAASVYPELAYINERKFHADHNETVKLDSIRNGLWIGFPEGLFFFSFESKHLYGPHYNPDNLPLFRLKNIITLSIAKNSIWFTRDTAGVHQYVFTDNKTFVGNLQQPVNKFINTSFLFSDSKERLWIVAWNGDVHVYKGSRLTLVGNRPENPYDLPGFGTKAIYEDAQRNIWLGSIGAITKLPNAPLIQKMFHLPTPASTGINMWEIINNFSVISDTLLWVCTDLSLVKFNYETGAVVRYRVPTQSIRGNRFYYVKRIGGTWWCGTGEGIQLFDPEKNLFTAFKHYSKMSLPEPKSVIWIEEDRHGSIWFGVWLGAIYRYDPSTDTCTKMNEPGYGESNIVGTHCYKDSNGTLWFGTENSGIRYFDHDRNKFVNPWTNNSRFNSMKIFSITEDKDKNLALGTMNHGVIKMDMTGKILEQYTMKDGLKNNSIISVVYDKKNNLWTSSASGISKFTSDERIGDIYVNFGSLSILVNAPLFPFRNSMLIASMNSIAAINPEYESTESNLEPALVSGILINNKKEVLWGDNNEIQIEPGNDSFTFLYASPNHGNYAALQYSYKLEGYEDDWHDMQSLLNATYLNVPPGKYTFRLRAASNNNRWVESPQRIRVHVLPSWWQTSAFKILAFLLGLLGLIIAFESYKRRKQEKLLENAIGYLAGRLEKGSTLNEICLDILSVCVGELKIDYCAVYLRSHNGEEFYLNSERSQDETFSADLISPTKIKEVASTGNLLIEKDTVLNTSTVWVPIQEEGQIIGLIRCSKKRKYFFNKAYVKTLKTIASMNAAKISEANARSEAKEKTIELLELDKLLAETKFMALRSQMNPHFVFNCLNNIEYFFVINDYNKARYYLNSFSKLMRHILLNASDNFISVAEEMQVLEYYLKLEQMRFQERFEYRFENENVDLLETYIPSMLLQPFVENAIVHGFRPDQQKGMIIISFKKLKDDIIQCRIEDNGIGRKEAQERKNPKHKSKGLKLVEDRLLLLRKQGYFTSLTFQDKYNSAEQAEGTIVELQLSVDD